MSKGAGGADRIAAIKSRGRRSLSNVGGVVDLGGDKSAGAQLAHALNVLPASEARGEGPDRAHVHGFHSYPARLHPDTAARLIAAFAPEHGVVLDPFCGGGTVLVEALVAGHPAVGVDLNPLAVLLSRAKTRPRTVVERERIALSAREVRAHADERRKRRAGATRRFPPADVELFDPHVLLELDGLRAGIQHVGDEALRTDLLLVLSAILVKLSKQRSDTSERTADRRLAAGYPAKLFQRKAEELAARLADFECLLPSPRPAARVAADDAVRLGTVADSSVDCIVTSPPYAATYDYLAHHAVRFRWLGLDARAFERGELGARRRYRALAPREAREAWHGELKAFFRASERVTKPRSKLVLLVGDSVIGREPLRADEIIADVANGTRFSCVARASQARPHFYGPGAEAFRGAPRAEHALLLVRR